MRSGRCERNRRNTSGQHAAQIDIRMGTGSWLRPVVPHRAVSYSCPAYTRSALQRKRLHTVRKQLLYTQFRDGQRPLRRTHARRAFTICPNSPFLPHSAASSVTVNPSSSPYFLPLTSLFNNSTPCPRKMIYSCTSHHGGLFFTSLSLYSSFICLKNINRTSVKKERRGDRGDE